MILAVAHREFIEQGAEALRAWGTPNAVLYDVKAALPRADVDRRLREPALGVGARDA